MSQAVSELRTFPEARNGSRRLRAGQRTPRAHISRGPHARRARRTPRNHDQRQLTTRARRRGSTPDDCAGTLENWQTGRCVFPEVETVAGNMDLVRRSVFRVGLGGSMAQARPTVSERGTSRGKPNPRCARCRDNRVAGNPRLATDLSPTHPAHIDEHGPFDVAGLDVSP